MWVISASQSSSGCSATKRRRTRSGAGGAAGLLAGWTRRRLPRRETPSTRAWRMSRAIRFLPTRTPWARRRWTSLPGVVPGAGDREHAAEPGDSMLCLLRFDQPKAHGRRSVSRAKNVAACFRISRSSSSTRTLFRSSLSASRSSLVSPSRSPAAGDPRQRLLLRQHHTNSLLSELRRIRRMRPRHLNTPFRACARKRQGVNESGSTPDRQDQPTSAHYRAVARRARGTPPVERVRRRVATGRCVARPLARMQTTSPRIPPPNRSAVRRGAAPPDD
jgi:hypothetical protein